MRVGISLSRGTPGGPSGSRRTPKGRAPCLSSFKEDWLDDQVLKGSQPHCHACRQLFWPTASPTVRASSQIPKTIPRVAQPSPEHSIPTRLKELKVIKCENLLDRDLVVLVLVGSFDKVLQKVAGKCQLLIKQHFQDKPVVPGDLNGVSGLVEELENLLGVNFAISTRPLAVDQSEEPGHEVQCFRFRQSFISVSVHLGIEVVDRSWRTYETSAQGI